jgi:nucleoid-associated protein YgaU
MPVKPASRYRPLAVYNAPDAAGRSHPTVPLRPPSPAAEATIVRHVVTAGESLELLAWRYYGSSEAWWRIADANPRRHPLALLSGDKLSIPSPGAVGRIERTRKF